MLTEKSFALSFVALLKVLEDHKLTPHIKASFKLRREPAG
jgi:hypothetical protein